jgi:hypothetical protein
VIDLKTLLEKGGIVIATAEAARDSIVARIDKDLERRLEEATREIEDLKDRLREKDAALISFREAAQKAEMENIRLKMHAAEPEKK